MPLFSQEGGGLPRLQEGEGGLHLIDDLGPTGEEAEVLTLSDLQRSSMRINDRPHSWEKDLLPKHTLVSALVMTPVSRFMSTIVTTS